MSSVVQACGQALALLLALAMVGPASAGYMDVVLGDGPVAYYRLGETANPVANSGWGGSALNGGFENFVASDLGQAGPRPAGYLGFETTNQAPRFNYNGSSERVAVPDNPALDITGALSLEAWVKLDALSTSNQGIIAKYQGGSFGNQRAYNFYVDNQTTPAGQGCAALIISPDGTFGSASTVLGTTNLNDGKWHYVVAIYKPSSYMRIYVDGKLQNENTTGIPSAIANTTAPLWLGLQYDTAAGYHLDGYLDEAAVYSYLLDDPNGDGNTSDSRILAHYVAAFTASAPPTGPEVLYREVFPNNVGADRPPSYAGWNAFGSATATALTNQSQLGVSYGVGRPTSLEAVNSFPVSAEQSAGYFSDWGTGGVSAPRFYWTDEFPIDLSVYALQQAQWYQGNGNGGDAFRVAVQLDGGQWYASASSFTNTGGVTGGTFQSLAELKVFDFEGAEWYFLNFTPGSLLQLVTTGGSFDLPAGNYLTGFGLFSETRLSTLRFDSFELIVDAAILIPEPATVALVGLGLAALARRRRAKAK